MKKRILKKSEVLREGYEQGLREGLNIINQMIAEANGEQINEGLWDQMKAFGKGFSGQTNRNNRHNTKMDADAEEAKQLKQSYKQDRKTAEKNWDAKLRDESEAGMKEAEQMRKDALKQKKGRFSGALKKGVENFKKQRSIDKKADERATAAKKEADAKKAEEKRKAKEAETARKKSEAQKNTVSKLVNTITDKGEDIAKMVLQQLQTQLA